MPTIQVDAPNAGVAALLPLSHHIDSRPTPPPAGTSFGLIVIKPPPCDPNVPHHDLVDEAGMRHLDVECRSTANRRALTAGQCDRSKQPRRRPTGGTPSTARPEQPIDTRFPGQHFPLGSVVTSPDRHRRTVVATVTELRRHEAVVARGETGR